MNLASCGNSSFFDRPIFECRKSTSLTWDGSGSGMGRMTGAEPR